MSMLFHKYFLLENFVYKYNFLEEKTLKLLREDLSKFYMLYNQLKQAKNKNERKEVKEELDIHKKNMIKDFGLKDDDKDPHIEHYCYDNDLFKRDVENIITDIENKVE